MGGISVRTRTLGDQFIVRIEVYSSARIDRLEFHDKEHGTAATFAKVGLKVTRLVETHEQRPAWWRPENASAESAVEEVPLTENPTPSEASKWLDTVEARCKEKRPHASQTAAPESNLSPEERSEVTSRAYLKHCREMATLTADLWEEVPADSRDLKVVQSLMGPVAAQLGITEPFTVVPNPDPAESNRLVEELEEMAAEGEEVKEKVAA